MKHPEDEYSPSKMKHNQPKYVQDSSKKRKAAQIRKPKFDNDSDEEEMEDNASSDEDDEDEVICKRAIQYTVCFVLKNSFSF